MEELRNERGQTLSEFLDEYDETRYRRPSVTVDMAVFTLLNAAAMAPLMGEEDAAPDYRLGVLLIRRKDHPHIGKWALPGGFVEFNEDLPAAAARELEEETGLTGLTLRQFGAFGAPDRDPRTRVITAAYYAVAPFGALSPKAGDDAAAAGLFTVDLKLLAQCASAERFRMTLGSGPLTLRAEALRRFDSLGAETAAVKGGDLAGDHAHVLFSALCALEAQPRARIARLLGGGDPRLERAAEHTLDALFRQFI